MSLKNFNSNFKFSYNILNKRFASLLSIQRMLEKRQNLKKDDNKSKVKEQLKMRFESNSRTTREVCSTPQEAFEKIKKIPKLYNNQTLGITVALNIDTKRGDQTVRGLLKYPGGSNKIPRVAVFTSPGNHEVAKAAGADIIADAETFKKINDGIIEFDKTVCTLDTLPSLKNYGRILGPKGLMPSVKIGTACPSADLEKIIKDLKKGSKEFNADLDGQIHLPLGRYDLNTEGLLMNLDSLMTILLSKQPESVKDRFFLYVIIHFQKHAFKIDMNSLDPRSPTYFYRNNSHS